MKTMTHLEFLAWGKVNLYSKLLGSRLGQRFCNEVLEEGDEPWPELFYEVNDRTALDIISMYVYTGKRP